MADASDARDLEREKKKAGDDIEQKEVDGGKEKKKRGRPPKKAVEKSSGLSAEGMKNYLEKGKIYKKDESENESGITKGKELERTPIKKGEEVGK